MSGSLSVNRVVAGVRTGVAARAPFAVESIVCVAPAPLLLLCAGFQVASGHSHTHTKAAERCVPLRIIQQMHGATLHAAGPHVYTHIPDIDQIVRVVVARTAYTAFYVSRAVLCSAPHRAHTASAASQARRGRGTGRVERSTVTLRCHTACAGAMAGA